jgi:hypothetical protein
MMNPVFSIHSADTTATNHFTCAVADHAFKNLNITPSIVRNRHGLVIASADVDQETFDAAFNDAKENLAEFYLENVPQELHRVCTCGACSDAHINAELHDVAMSAMNRGLDIAEAMDELSNEMQSLYEDMAHDYPICHAVCLSPHALENRLSHSARYMTVSTLVDSVNEGSVLRHTAMKKLATLLS